tara:strand:+ start:622 stop:951 length:330 start_codon:yes stop_codon:yes gene_type:complete
MEINLLLLFKKTNIYKYLIIFEFNKILLINKYFKQLNNKEYDYIWKYYCILKFNKEYWIKAKEKNKKNILNSWKDELKRIYNFELKIKRLGLPLWEKEDYYYWWDICNK